jgi:hypothetical protein
MRLAKSIQPFRRPAGTPYRFRNPLLRPYVMMKGIADDLLTVADLAGLKTNKPIIKKNMKVIYKNPKKKHIPPGKGLFDQSM